MSDSTTATNIVPEDTSSSVQTKRPLSSSTKDTVSTTSATASEETIAPSEDSLTEPPSKKTKVDAEMNNENSKKVDPAGLPADHLNHQENWATGEDPATGPQLGFIDALTSKAGLVPLSAEEKAELGKSAASVMIDDLKHGKTGNLKAASSDGECDRPAVAEKKTVEETKESRETPSTKDETPSNKTDQKPEPETTKPEAESEAKPTKTDEPAHKLENTTAAEPAPSDVDPDSHLAHPESWATGEDPATAKQLGYIAVLAEQKGVELTEEEKTKMGKSEASEKIDELRHQ
ncbi:Protein of unknown function DUF3072 [Phaffia rhodozyma]|uniref:Uncharacterized protein n=1 Tax=Phaffia rhodozyma TaxID=264483 RepID=A0A0F7SSD5_PHARH|nr:Protein of unknown function DUF3072 [Phaffia rhodozyma]